jgi:hypothetical protein
MMNGWQPNVSHTPLDGAPTWFVALQAGLVGLVAGLALYVILSFAVVQARNGSPAADGPKECKKAEPVREVVAPPPYVPVLSRLGGAARVTG